MELLCVLAAVAALFCGCAVLTLNAASRHPSHH